MSLKSDMTRQVLREYDALRTKAANSLKIKMETAFAKAPRLRKIEREISQMGIQSARLILDNPHNAVELTEELKGRLLELKREKKELLQAAGFPENYLTAEYQCNLCQDTGYIENEKCSCFRQRLIEKAYGLSNLKDVLERENFDTFDFRCYSDKMDERTGESPRENMKKLYNACVNFTQNFDEKFQNLLLYGSTGLGKTFLCNCIAKELLDMGKTVLYVTATQLFKMIETERFRKDEETEISHWQEDLFSVDLLMIDDLGTEFSTVLSNSELFNIINTRLLDRKNVILSTNLSPSELASQYSDRIFSRIAGSYSFLFFYGEDIRIKQNLGTRRK